jgi:predicted phosphodiesterase
MIYNRDRVSANRLLIPDGCWPLEADVITLDRSPIHVHTLKVFCLRIYGLGDLHADFAANRELIESLSGQDYLADTLLVAGDVAHRPELIRAILVGLRRRFAHVFFVPGNHDLWVAGAATEEVTETSLDRLDEIWAICEVEGIQRERTCLGALEIVPLLSWYEPGLDGGSMAGGVDDTDEVMRRLGRRWADRRYCRWPSHLATDPSRCQFFEQINETILDGSSTKPLLTFSHFCPRTDLLPDVKYLRFGHLPRVAGSPRLDRQIRSAGSRLHLYGHTHIPQNMVIEGVRYVNAPLGYPRERERWGREGIRLRLLVDDADNISAETIAAAKLTDDRSNRASRRTTRI